MDRGAWRATVHGVTESDTTERQSSQSRPCARGRGSLPDLEGASPWHTLTCSLLSSPGPWRIMVTFSLPYPLQGQDKRKQALLQQKMLGICLQRRRSRFDSWVGKIPWRRKCQPTPVFLPGESHARRSLGGYSPWGRRRRTRLSNQTTTSTTEGASSTEHQTGIWVGSQSPCPGLSLLICQMELIVPSFVRTE